MGVGRGGWADLFPGPLGALQGRPGPGSGSSKTTVLDSWYRRMFQKSDLRRESDVPSKR